MPKGFGYGGESANQEKSNLLKDNPVARTAAGDRPWISRHYRSTMSSAKPSPMNEGHEGGENETSPAMDKGHGKNFTDEHFPSGKHRSDINKNYDSVLQKSHCHHGKKSYQQW